MTDAEFLRWLVERLIYVYGENTNTDFVIRLRDLAWSLEAQNPKVREERSNEEERYPRPAIVYKPVDQAPGNTTINNVEVKIVSNDDTKIQGKVQ